MMRSSLFSLFVLAAVSSLGAAEAPGKLNIVLIMADDKDYGVVQE